MSLYLEVREGVTPLLQASASQQAALEQFGLTDLLQSSEPAERNAAYAVAEAQGRSGARSNVVSRIALAGSGLPVTTAFALGLDAGPGSQESIAILAHQGADDAMVLDPQGALHRTSLGCAQTLPSSLDPEYLSVLSYPEGLLEPLAVPGGEFMLTRARIACSAEILGSCDAMLADAVAYARSRHQFGKPLAAFQAVAHALAWAATEIHQLRALLDTCLHADAVTAPPATLAAVTKAMAGTVARRVAQSTLQVTGGMGFTWEYTHNARHRRVLALDAVAGSANALQLELGRALRSGNQELISLSTLAEPLASPGLDTPA